MRFIFGVIKVINEPCFGSKQPLRLDISTIRQTLTLLSFYHDKNIHFFYHDRNIHFSAYLCELIDCENFPYHALKDFLLTVLHCFVINKLFFIILPLILCDAIIYIFCIPFYVIFVNVYQKCFQCCGQSVKIRTFRSPIDTGIPMLDSFANILPEKYCQALSRGVQ